MKSLEGTFNYNTIGKLTKKEITAKVNEIQKHLNKTRLHSCSYFRNSNPSKYANSKFVSLAGRASMQGNKNITKHNLLRSNPNDPNSDLY
jgi:hypothetical protein